MTVPEIVDIFCPEDVDRLRRLRKLDPQFVRVLRNRLLKRFVSDEEALADFPAADCIRLHPLDLHQRFDSDLDGATKLLFKTEAGLLLETVLLRIATGRTTVCVSSQVGCAAACVFCATGKMGIARNLTASEIVDQVLQAGQRLRVENRRLHNIVFMGMGEPFHNESALWQAMEILTAADHFHRSPGGVLVSSVGVADAMVRFAERFPKVNLALSLHSVDQPTRQQIIPLAKKVTLDELRRALGHINQIQQRELMIEYLLLSGVNDSATDARDLIRWLAPLRVHVNLIPYNAIDGAPDLTGTSSEGIQAFANILKSAGLKTTIRYSLGTDIAAACGQLVRRENRKHRRGATQSADTT